MSKQLQLRRGTTSQNASFIGAQAELVADTELNVLRLHDGITAGGHVIGTTIGGGGAGTPGPQGAQGPQGPQGIQGPTGLQGPQGLKGDTGTSGSTGPQGPKGDPGTPGADGAVGPQGPKGDTGNTGPAGADGSLSGNLVVNGNTITTLNALEGITLAPSGSGEVHIPTNLGIFNANPGRSLEIGNVADYKNTGEVNFNYFDGTSASGSALLGWDWDDGLGNGSNALGGLHARFGIFNHGSYSHPMLTFDSVGTGTFENIILAKGGIMFGDGTSVTTATGLGGGMQGAQGPQGTAGQPGETGSTGPQGSQGPMGNPGLQGPQGDVGPQGLHGTNGNGFTSVPSTAVGIPGDGPGLAAIDSTYLYYCTGTYDGTTQIWYRQALTGSAW